MSPIQRGELENIVNAQIAAIVVLSRHLKWIKSNLGGGFYVIRIGYGEEVTGSLKFGSSRITLNSKLCDTNIADLQDPRFTKDKFEKLMAKPTEIERSAGQIAEPPAFDVDSGKRSAPAAVGWDNAGRIGVAALGKTLWTQSRIGTLARYKPRRIVTQCPIATTI